MLSQEEKICPVCDTKLSKETTKCPICGTDLSKIDEKVLQDIDLSILKDKTKAIDDILSLLEKEEKAQEKKVEEKKDAKPEKKPEKVEEGVSKEEVKSEKEKGEVFFCPLCNAEIPLTATTCPKCGAIFEEALVFICPVCNAEVPADATTCPKCGAIFVGEEVRAEEVAESKAEKGIEERREEKVEEKKKVEEVEKKVERKAEDMAKELALKVSEAKVLVETLKKFNVDEKEIKEEISKALSAGKEKEYERALTILENALAKGKKAVMESIAVLAGKLEEELNGYAKLGCDIRKGVGLCERAIFATQIENFERAVRTYTMALDFAKEVKEKFEGRKKEFEEILHSIEEFISFGVPGVNGLKKMVDEAMAYYAKGEVENGNKRLAAVKEKLSELLPNYVTGKIAEHAAKLREEKLLGLDIREKIEYLKEANMCIKRKDYMGALAWVKKLEMSER